MDGPPGPLLPDDDEEPIGSTDIEFSEVSFDGAVPEFRDVRARPLTFDDPSRIGDYSVLRSFRSGPAARVYLGYRSSMHGVVRPVLLKFVADGALGYEDFRHALIDEARAMSGLAHPNLVSILDTGEDEKGAYIVLEYVAGTDLGRILQALRFQERRFPINMACYVAVSVLRGLHHAHNATTPDGEPLDLVHRDVNPPNILVSNSGHVKLGDFGIALMRRRLQDKTAPGHVKGKFAYLAPEYVAEGDITPALDVYGVGLTLFEMISGRQCFSDEKAQVVLREIVHKGVPVEELRDFDVPDNLVEIVRRATSRSVEGRYSSASEMASALELWLLREGSYVGSALFRNFLAQRPYTVDSLANELAFSEE